MLSLQDLPLRKPACSLRMSFSPFKRMGGIRDSSACSISALMPSAPGALAFFILLMALFISWIEGGPVFMSMSLPGLGLCFQVLVG